jgi:hypothetical protein
MTEIETKSGALLQNVLARFRAALKLEDGWKEGNPGCFTTEHYGTSFSPAVWVCEELWHRSPTGRVLIHVRSIVSFDGRTLPERNYEVRQADNPDIINAIALAKKRAVIAKEKAEHEVQKKRECEGLTERTIAAIEAVGLTDEEQKEYRIKPRLVSGELRIDYHDTHYVSGEQAVRIASIMGGEIKIDLTHRTLTMEQWRQLKNVLEEVSDE